MHNGSTEQRALVRSCIEQGDEQHFDVILAAISSSGALDYTRGEAEKAATRASQAIAGLPDSQYKTSLLDLCTFAVDRNH
ncbi:octaprenyl diphosphate synthase [Oxalobacteraceae bacterium IMCC9480]|nr:octaprenyl diphosphate synthase [Oxalobacteraceae bacterium IMCC9480]